MSTNLLRYREYFRSWKCSTYDFWKSIPCRITNTDVIFILRLVRYITYRNVYKYVARSAVQSYTYMCVFIFINQPNAYAFLSFLEFSRVLACRLSHAINNTSTSRVSWYGKHIFNNWEVRNLKYFEYIVVDWTHHKNSLNLMIHLSERSF